MEAQVTRGKSLCLGPAVGGSAGASVGSPEKPVGVLCGFCWKITSISQPSPAETRTASCRLLCQDEIRPHRDVRTKLTQHSQRPTARALPWSRCRAILRLLCPLWGLGKKGAWGGDAFRQVGAEARTPWKLPRASVRARRPGQAQCGPSGGGHPPLGCLFASEGPPSTPLGGWPCPSVCLCPTLLQYRGMAGPQRTVTGHDHACDSVP